MNPKKPAERDHISEYKRKIMTYLNTNKHIVEWCGGEYGKKQNGKVFFPYEFIPETIETTFCGVCFDVLMNYNQYSAYEDMAIYFYIMCHVEAAVSPELPGLRYDMIAHQITKDFADKPFFGIGKCEIVLNRPYHVSRLENVMRGRVLAFEVTDFSAGILNRRANKLSL